MRKVLISLAAAASAVAIAAPASAQVYSNIGIGLGYSTPGYGYGYGTPGYGYGYGYGAPAYGYGNGYGYGVPSYGYGYNGYGYNQGYNQVRALQVRVDSVQRQINVLDRQRVLSNREARHLRDQSRGLERQLYRAARYGLNPYEARDINTRIARLEQRVQREAWDRNGRWGRY